MLVDSNKSLDRLFSIQEKPVLVHCEDEQTIKSNLAKAVEKYGAIKGVYLSVKRILKCHPFHSGGYDPLE